LGFISVPEHSAHSVGLRAVILKVHLKVSRQGRRQQGVIVVGHGDARFKGCPDKVGIDLRSAVRQVVVPANLKEMIKGNPNVIRGGGVEIANGVGKLGDLPPDFRWFGAGIDATLIAILRFTGKDLKHCRHNYIRTPLTCCPHYPLKTLPQPTPFSDHPNPSFYSCPLHP
jgi:hypothetical protein